MSTAAAASAPTPEPDAARAAGGRVQRVLSVLRWIVAYGQELTGTMRQHAATAAHAFIVAALPFGTLDPGLILARIARGLRLAAALEQRLLALAARGKDLPGSSSSCPPRDTQPNQRKQRKRRPRPAGLPDDPRTAPLTDDEIAEFVRRRSVGAMFVIICHEFGIRPGTLRRPEWDELRHVIIAHNGNLARYFIEGHRRVFDRAFFRACTSALQQADAALAAQPDPPRAGAHPPVLTLNTMIDAMGLAAQPFPAPAGTGPP